jgi:hypothetical protein
MPIKIKTPHASAIDSNLGDELRIYPRKKKSENCNSSLMYSQHFVESSEPSQHESKYSGAADDSSLISVSSTLTRSYA